MSFWIATGIMTLIAAAWMTRALWRQQSVEDVGVNSELDIYRDQLRELDSDVARGLLSAQEASASKIEIQRRLLRAADQNQKTAQTGKAQPLVAGVIALVLAAASFATYLALGSPDYPDQPRQARLDAAMANMQNRPLQAAAEARFPQIPLEATAEHVALLSQLRDVLDSGRGNEEGYRLYIEQNLQIARYKEAYTMQVRLIDELDNRASSEDFGNLAEYMVFAASGYVSPEAEAALVEALRKNANNPKARYFSGLVAFQNGRPDFTLSLWAALQREGHGDTYWMQDINERISIAATLAGVRYEPPLRGPSQDQINAAQQMTPEDRAAMIETMVEGLAERLEEGDGTIEEWMRLIRAYGVLGRTADASDTWAKARALFSDDPASLARLRDAARDAEVAQ